jgi:DNA ligase-1
MPFTDIYEPPSVVEGWLLCEKLDGVRVYWDGKTLFSNQGTKIEAPESFTRDLPAYSLDGELWYRSVVV